MMTKGDKKWISNWKPTGVNMKPIKKKPAKKKSPAPSLDPDEIVF